MRARLSISVVGLAFAAVLAAIVTTGSWNTSQAKPAMRASPSISVRQTSLGRTLADSNGRTLYLFAPDKRDMSTLSAAGRSVWPPFTSTRRPSATSGAKANQVGIVSGAQHPAQVTYHGHPLYYFAGDHSPGQTAGQGLNDFGGRWYVLSPAGSAVTVAPKASAKSGSSSPGSASAAYNY